MGTIADKLLYLNETKTDLRATLNGLLGLSLDANTPFRRYAYEADMAAMRGMFASGELGGYWEPTLSSYYEDSAGTIQASVNGVVGAWGNQISGGPTAIQSTTANKPYLRKTLQTKRYWLDGNTSTANLTAKFSSSPGSNCTIARLDPELGVQWSEAQTVGTTYNLITPYAYHGPMLIINRALTAQEKAIVARVMNRFMPQLGPESVVNGTFATDLSGWSNTSNHWQWVNGRAYFPYFTEHRPLVQVVNTAGSAYLLSVDFERVQGSMQIIAGVNSGVNVVSAHNTSGNKRMAVRSERTSQPIQFSRAGSLEGYIDNVSVRSLL